MKPTRRKPTLEQQRKIACRGLPEAALVILNDPERYEKYGEDRVRMAERERKLAEAKPMVRKAGGSK
jgi:hypothetical protein